MPDIHAKQAPQHDFMVEPIQFMFPIVNVSKLTFKFGNQVQAGIYSINIGDHWYIGKSKNIPKRWLQWKNALSKNDAIPNKFSKILCTHTECIFSVVEAIRLRNGGAFSLPSLERKWYNIYKDKGLKMLNTVDLIGLQPQFQSTPFPSESKTSARSHSK